MESVMVTRDCLCTKQIISTFKLNDLKFLCMENGGSNFLRIVCVSCEIHNLTGIDLHLVVMYRLT